MKILRLVFLSMLCAVAFPAFAQLNIGTVDLGPYTPGSTIAATFTIDPVTCIAQGNVFSLRLSDENGNFSPGIVIGTYNSFYSTFVNGTIPLGTPVGTGYKVRIESSTPILTTLDSTPFEIRAGTEVQTSLITSSSLSNDAFGFCTNKTGTTAEINMTNSSTAGGVISVSLKNELTQAVSSLTFTNNDYATFTPDAAHYTAIVKILMPDGRVSTRAYFIINNDVNTSFIPSNSSYVCLPGGILEYFIDVTGPKGIQNNFPGNTYRINWGDNQGNIYTFCDLKSGRVEHLYTKSSCGQQFRSGNTIIYNVFGIITQPQSPFSCGGNNDIGSPVATTAKVVTITKNLFEAPEFGCTNSAITFTNTSILGEDPNTNSPTCISDDTKFNWYVNGVLRLNGVSKSTNFTYPFLTHNSYTIRLESTGVTGCSGPVFEKIICIQDPPKPSFNLPSSTICAGSTLAPENTSLIDNLCNNNNNYLWVVSPATSVSYVSGTDATSKDPQFLFGDAGIYTIKLTISTNTCGSYTTEPQQVVVNTTPTATLSPNAALCSINTYDFNPTTSGPTKTIFTGTSLKLTDTYTWSVTGGAINYVGGTGPNTQYPSIKFLDYTNYTVSVTHKNNCGTVTTSQTISFTPAPTVNAGADQPICFNDVVNLSGSVIGAVLTKVWVGGSGIFSDRNDVNSTYTPSATEKTAGQVTLILRATTSLPTPCNQIDDEVVITIKPEVTLTSDNSKSICTGTNVNYIPTSATAGTTFAWTATGTANAGGFTTSGTGIITDVLTNSNPTLDATVTYIITPTGNGCVGVPFTLTVTVTPRPVVTPTAILTICSGQNANINLTSNLGSTTRYTWTSTSTTGITGNRSNATPTSTATINDVLFNNTTTAGTVDYIITPISATGCPGTPTTITITVEPQPTAPNAGADESVCNTTSYTFKGNTPTVGTGLWTQVTTFPSVTFTNPTQFNGTANGLIAGNTYIFRWTITGASSCNPKTDDVEITINPLSVGGITAGFITVCAGSNTGQITLSGQVGSVVRWESSTDNGLTYPNIINNTTTTLNYTNLTNTTYYRAIVQSGSCAIAISTPSIITVNQGAVVATAGPDQNLCNVTSTVLAGNDPEGNAGLWTIISGQTTPSFVDDTKYNTTVNDLVPGQTYTFKWTISGLAPCPPSNDDIIVKINLPSDGGITAGSTAVCAGSSNGQITLSGQLGNIVRWESSTDNFVTTDIINTTLPFINYLNLTATTQYRAVVKNGSCAEATSAVATVTVNQGAVGALTGPDQNLCNVPSTVLTGNDPLTNTGLWTIISGQTTTAFADASKYNTTVSGLVGGQTYVFRWTISGLAPCPASSDDIVVTNLSALLNNNITTPITTNCTGQTITITGSLPTGGGGTYTYVWQSSPTGAAPWTTITGQTARDLNVTVSASLSYQRIVTSDACSTTSNTITITTLPAITNNTIAADQTICLTTTPNAITGSQPTGGDGINYTYSWEQSIDNGVTWSVVTGTNTQNYSPPAITQTTLYRRLIASSVCAGSLQSVSNTIKITVNLNARAEFTFTNDLGCIPFLIDANNIKAVPYPAQNAIYTWYADGVVIGTGITFPGYTIATDNTSVIIKLVTTSSLGCLPSEMSHTFKTRQNVVASYTQSSVQGCGPLSVTFTNTTTGLLPGFTFEWRVDNTVISNVVDPGTIVFVADPAGNDKIYNVSLRVVTPCGPSNFSSTVTVRPMPIAAFLPSTTNGCSPLAVVFQNTSPGSSTVYSYDFDDGTTSPATTSKADVSHTFITNLVKDYNVKMTATNECGTDTKTIIIRVSPNTITPALIVNGNQLRGCAPFTVDFINNSRGASRFTYTFEPGVVVISNTVQTEVRPYTFTKAGTYTVTMVADNGCSTASAQVTIVVDPQPTISFKADATTGCIGLTVKFTKTSTDAVSYVWDFGDGTSSNAADPTHIYAGPAAQHDVTLTAFNSLGCPIVLKIPNYITTVDQPVASFAIFPAAVISIPEYTFKFTDESTNGAETYKWSFGDGDISSLKDPIHKYRDTGKYLVTMRTYNEYGCVDSLQKYVQIVGVPGYVYFPNSFIPGGTSSELQTFIALGSGIKAWKMQVFNKWGQTLWETTKLVDSKPVEGWDGNYKGVPQPQGIYFWKIDVELLNGSEWKGMTFGTSAPKRTGEIYLIR